MDSILFVGVVIYLMITAYTGYAAIEKLKGSHLSEEKRIQRYRFSFLWNIVSGGVVMLMIGIGPAILEETGFRPVHILSGSYKYLAVGTCILCAALSAIFIFQITAKTFPRKSTVFPISAILRGIIMLYMKITVLLTGIVTTALIISRTDNTEM